MNFRLEYIVLEIPAPFSGMWYCGPVTIIKYQPGRKGKYHFGSHECRLREWESPGMGGIVCFLGRSWVACGREEVWELRRFR